VTAVGKYDFARIVAVGLPKGQGLNVDNIGDIEFLLPESLTTFDAKTLWKSHHHNPVTYGVSSKEIKALSFSTIHLLTASGLIITDDEVPLEELYQGIVDAFEAQKHGELSQAQARESRHRAIVQIRKQDFDRIRSKVQQSLLRPEPRGEEEPLDVRAQLLNELARRDQILRGGEDYENNRFISCMKFLRQVTDDNKTAEELLGLMLASCGDEMPEELKQAATQMQEGVESVAPVSDEQVADVKKKLASGMAGMFKKKAAEVPNFAQILLDAEQNDIDCLREYFKDPTYDSQRFAFMEYDYDVY